MTDNSPQLGGQSDVTGREPELSGARGRSLEEMAQTLAACTAMSYGHALDILTALVLKIDAAKLTRLNEVGILERTNDRS